MSFDSLDAQLADPGDFWMRLFASGEGWAPDWVAEDCGVSSYGPDYDDQRHLPIWDECVWGHLMDTYRALFAAASENRDAVLKVTFLDTGNGSFTVDTDAGSSAAVERADSGQWRTATIALPDGAVGADAMRLHIALAAGADDLVVRFARLVRTE